jgi:hypothetical protein
MKYAILALPLTASACAMEARDGVTGRDLYPTKQLSL